MAASHPWQPRSSALHAVSCELCDTPGGTVVWSGPAARVVLVDDALHPGFCRVIHTAHVAEMTDLAPVERAELMTIVFAVEAALRRLLPVDKINLASLGNMVPHLHWHVIPRYRADGEFPGAIWAQARRVPVDLPAAPSIDALRLALSEAFHNPP